MKKNSKKKIETCCLKFKAGFSFQKKRLCLLLLLFFVFSVDLFSQTTVTGTVRDEIGNALQGVSVNLKGTATTTSTDGEGRYSIVCPNLQGILVFSSVGFSNEEVSLNNRNVVNVEMRQRDLSLGEVVVTGYTTQRKKDITGSVTVVDVGAMKSVPAGSAMQALQGQAAGVNVVNSGVPGASSNIIIRGVSSFGDIQPLVLIDGVQGNMNNINTDDIESIQILKDAGAASIYGVRGSNGVIVITTKKGKSGAPTFSYHGYYGNQVPKAGNPLNLLKSQDFARLYNIAFPSSALFQNGIPDFIYGGSGGRGTGMTGDAAVDPSKYNLDMVDPSNNYIIQKVNKEGTDWFHAFFEPAPTASHNISASGGTGKSNYLLSLEYYNQQGVGIGTYLKRYSARINTEFKLPANFRIGENAYVFNSQSPEFRNQADFAPISQIYQMMPIIPLYDIKGNFGGTFGGPADIGDRSNPVAGQKSAVNNRNNIWNVIGNVYAEVDFLNNFTLRTSFGGTISNRYSQTFNFTRYWDASSYLLPNSYSESAAYNTNSTWTNTLVYKSVIGKHSIKLLAGSEAIRNYGREVGGSAQRFFSSNFEYLILNNGTSNISNFSNANINTLFSLFTRVDYTFSERYLLAVTIRRDGSSKFGSQKKYGTFPSFSAGWRVTNEKFMKNIAWLNDLKFRGSYGVLGSENNVSPINSYTLFGGNIPGAYYDITGNGNSSQPGFYQTNIGNPLTGWEKDVVSNVGFDATVLNSLTFSFDIYKKSVNGLLFPQPLPATTGGAAAPVVNVGDIQNKGVDINAKYWGSLFADRLNFSINANVTTYKNTVIKIPGPGFFDAFGQQQLGMLVRNQEGHAVSSFFGYEVIGLFNSPDEVNRSPKQSGAAPGRFKYRDVNEDGEITTDDRTFLGHPNPDFTYGLNLQLEYKGFDVSAFFYGSQGNEIINALKVNSHFFGSYVGNKSIDLLNAWTPENTETTIPKIENVLNFSNAGAMNSFFVENGSYLRLKSLILGYTINNQVLRKLKASKLRLYLQATNLLTLTKYSGLDPELTGPTSSFGIDSGNYPNFKNFILGIDISF